MARTRRRDRRRAQPTATPTPAPGRAHQERQAAETARRSAPGPWPRTVATFAAIRAAITAQPTAAAVGAALVMVTFGLYLATAARDIVFGDTAELTAVALTGGVAHPPGYPVFTMIGWIFGQLPVGPLPFRIALLSVVCDTLTVGIVYAGTFRFTRSIPAAAVAGAALAVSPLFWVWSLVGEVFPLNNLLAATMLLLVALWHEHPERRALLVAGGLTGGLGAANQQTILFLGPAILYVMWLRRTVLLRHLSLVRNAAIAFVAGLAPYLVLIPLAAGSPAFSWSDIRGVGDLIPHVLRTDYGTAALIADPKFIDRSLQALFARVAALFVAMDPVFLVLVVAGAVAAWRSRQWYATYLLIGFAFVGPGFEAISNAKITDPTVQSVVGRFFLMPYVTIAPLAGFAVLGAGALAERLRLSRRAIELAAAGLTLAASVGVIAIYYPQVDQRDNHVARQFGEDLLTTMRPNALFFGGGDPIVFTIAYLQAIEHARPDVTVVETPLLSAEWYTRQLRRLHPDVVVTDTQYGGNAAPFKRFFDANRKRPLMAIGDLPDASTQQSYTFVSHGLIYDVHLINDLPALEDFAKDNEAMIAMYHPTNYSELVGPFRTWERITLADYSLAYYRVGHEYQIAGDGLKTKDPAQAAAFYAKARDWYQRALTVLPTLVEALAGIDTLPK